MITNSRYLKALGWPAGEIRADRLWQHLVESSAISAEHSGCLHTILSHGTLARRLRQASGENPDPSKLAAVYGELCDCLTEGRMFTGAVGP